MKKSNFLNIVLMSVGIIVGAYKYIWGGFRWYIEAGMGDLIMGSDILYFIFVSILAGMCSGFGVKIAKTARHNEEECKVLIKSGFWVVLVLSIGVAIMYACFIYPCLTSSPPTPEVYTYINIELETYIKGLLFTALFAYILVVIRALGDYKIPCLFIVCAVVIEWSMIRILMNISGFPGWYLPYIRNAKVLLNMFLFLGAYVYFRVKYSKWCRVKISIKIFFKTLIQFFKAGGVMGLLGLPLAFMVLIEIDKLINVDFLESTSYYGNFLLLGTVIMAPIMARLLVERYAED